MHGLLGYSNSNNKQINVVIFFLLIVVFCCQGHMLKGEETMLLLLFSAMSRIHCRIENEMGVTLALISVNH